MRRIHGLDLLRASAIGLVVAYHLPHWNSRVVRSLTHFGWTGVDLFFVLSGYLIASQYLAAPALGERPDTFRFYARRLLRTLPNYFVMLLVAKMAGGTFSEGIWRYMTFTQNFGIPSTFSVSWSLCIEEQFYLALPIVVLVAMQYRRSVVWLFAAVAIFGTGIRLLAWATYRPDALLAGSPDAAWEAYLSKLYYPTQARLDGLTVGVLIAAVRRFKPALWERMMARGNVLLVGGLLVLAVAYAVLVWQMSAAGCVLGFPLLAVGFGLLVTAAVSKDSVLNARKIPGVETIALLSYAMYLTHTQAIAVAAIIWPGSSLTCIGLAVAFAGALYLLVERPTMALRDRLLPVSRPSDARSVPAIHSEPL